LSNALAPEERVGTGGIGEGEPVRSFASRKQLRYRDWVEQESPFEDRSAWKKAERHRENAIEKPVIELG